MDDQRRSGGATVMDRAGGSVGLGGSYPVQLSIDRAPSNNRLFAVPLLGLLIREVVLIPHFIIAYALSVVAGLVSLVAWIPVLTSGQYPEWAYSIVTGAIRWNTRNFAYLLGLTDQYPPFSMGAGDNYPIQVTFEMPQNPSKFFAIPVLGFLARYIMLIPHFIALYVLGLVVAILQLVLWIPVLFGGRYPDFGYNLVGGTLGWMARVQGYLFGLSDAYPPFDLSA